MLLSQTYQNCIRTEKGYCAIQWKVSSTTSPDPFGVGVVGAYIESDGCDTSTVGAFIYIPNMSQDGIQRLPIGPASPAVNTLVYQSQQCGQYFGIDGMGTIQQPLVSKYRVSIHFTRL